MLNRSLHANPSDGQAPDELWGNSPELELPEANAIFLPGTYYVAVMPRLAPQKTAGGIYLPDDTKFKEQWLNYIGQIIGLGPLAFRHRKWREMGITDPENDPRVPKRGEFWCYRPHAPYRMQYKGIKFIALYDDSFIGKLPDGAAPWDYQAGV